MMKSVIKKLRIVLKILVILISLYLFLHLCFFAMIALSDSLFYYQFSDSNFTHWQIWIYIIITSLTPFLVCYWLIKYKFIYALSWLFLAFYINMYGHNFVYDLGYLRSLSICDDERSLCDEAQKEFEQAFGKIKKEEVETAESTPEDLETQEEIEKDES